MSDETLAEQASQSSGYDLESLARQARVAAEPCFLPLVVFAGLAAIEMVIRVAVFRTATLPVAIGYVWALYPLAFGGIWLALRMREQRTGVRATSAPWGWTALVLLLTAFPVGLVATFWGFGPLIVSLALLILAGVQRNRFLMRTAIALLAVSIVVPFVSYYFYFTAGASSICSSSSLGVQSPCTDAFGTLYGAGYQLVGLTLPIAFIVAAALAWLRERPDNAVR